MFLAPALLAAAAWWLFAAYDRFPLAAAEGRLLGWQVLAVLLALGLGGVPRRLTVAAAFGLGLLAWVLPPTPLRGIATGAALVTILLAGAWQARRAGAFFADWRLVPWAIALQTLTRPDLLLLPLTSRGLLLLLVVPALAAGALALLHRQRPAALVIAGLLLIVAGMLLAPNLAPAGLALLALALPYQGAIPPFAALLALGLAGLVSTAAAYPWLRVSPLSQLPAWLDLPAWLLVAIVAASVVGLGLAQDRWPARPFAPWLAAALGTALLLRALPAPGFQVLLADPATLTATGPVWFSPPATRPCRAVVVDSQLFHGAELPRGTLVAQVIARDAGGAIVQSWPLVAGEHSADWAALRSDVRAQPNFHAPPGELHAVAPDGSFFIPRFRARFALPAKTSIKGLTIERATTLPEATALALWRVEVRP